ncbi:MULTISPECIES: hypothetical protein [Janthinobacterium]|uniref:Uncharacterized protein n=1 Tax=Janthinobacterium kumbetense TaxID=2950280 RepID=A0ABT0WQ63_9BURK|nr:MULTISPECIES: hypothetical protein [Janthinobacterium]MCM2566205.1 hypothetical protein [Janthinobacterium kumbetense]MDO8069005.1 hypothetical protein [Janthinobacterium sp. SUN206]
MNKQKGKPTVRRKRMFGSYGLAHLAMQARQQDWRSAFLITGLIKIMLPQKKEIAKLFICTLTFPGEIKYDCGAPATGCHAAGYPLLRNRFLLVRAPDGR